MNDPILWIAAACIWLVGTGATLGLASKDGKFPEDCLLAALLFWPAVLLIAIPGAAIAIIAKKARKNA